MNTKDIYFFRCLLVQCFLCGICEVDPDSYCCRDYRLVSEG